MRPTVSASPLDWESDPWWAAVGEWTGAALRREGGHLTSAFAVVSGTAWRLEARVSSSRGDLRFIANLQPHLFEGPSLSAAAHLAPAGFTAPLAHERAQGWILLPAGEPSSLSAFLPLWAGVQHDLIPSRLALQAQGLPAMDPAWLPVFLENQIRHHSELPDDDALALSPAETARLSERVLPLVRAACERLAARSTPLALDPVTLRPEDCTPGLSRLSDASLSHPFTVLSTVAAAWSEAALPEADFTAAAIAYLRAMRPEATEQELLSEALDAAIVAPLNRYSALLRQTGNPAALNELRRLGTLPHLLERLFPAGAEVPPGTATPMPKTKPAPSVKPAPRRARRPRRAL